MSWNKSITRAHNQSQIDLTFRRTFERKFHVTEPRVHRLKIIHEFEGHSGCINCLEWHPSGGELISGSDDSDINIWNTQKLELKKTIKSGHNGNIFSVKYVNLTDSIASCAADGFVKVHDIETSSPTLNCSCHTHRVKRLATVRCEPFVFLSTGEDGIVLQHDSRAPHDCSLLISEGVLLNLNQILERACQIKCVSINPLQPHLFAIGANDPFVRLYDRRLLSVTHATKPIIYQQANTPPDNYHHSATHNVPIGCVQYYSAGHMTDLKLKSVACTDISFNANGTEFLANFGSEQIYLFDIIKKTPKVHFHAVDHIPSLESIPTSKKHFSPPYLNVYKNKDTLPHQIGLLANKGINAREEQKYFDAINTFNEAISMCPNSVVLLVNRARALFLRGWKCDMYSALMDCYTAIRLDDNFWLPHYYLMQSLSKLDRYPEALKFMEYAERKFPGAVNDERCIELKKRITSGFKSHQRRIEFESQRETDEYANRPSCYLIGDVAIRVELERDENYDHSGPVTVNLYQKEYPQDEQRWRQEVFDMKNKFIGHANCVTDIKEVKFFGRDDQYIVAGSDDGFVFFWDRSTTNITRVVRGDKSIVNCIQPHPTDCMLATSGIDKEVKLWAPKHEDGTSKEDDEPINIEKTAQYNFKFVYENLLVESFDDFGFQPNINPLYRDPEEDDESNSVESRRSRFFL